jgi:hypothetical protein
MAGFQTHITVSSALGLAYAAGAATQYGVPLPTCVLAGGLCAVSGMLPDLDSDSGVPLRESIAFAAAVIPMLMLDRWERLGYSPQTIALIGAAIYFGIRFGVAGALKRYTVHRGMFHSIPAMLIAGEVAFLVCAHANIYLRYYLAGGVMLGFVSHLLLDEIWSVNVGLHGVRVKKSFGTAFKFWGESGWGNISAYGKLALLSFAVWKDPAWMDARTPHEANLQYLANEAARGVLQRFDGNVPPVVEEEPQEDFTPVAPRRSAPREIGPRLDP